MGLIAIGDVHGCARTLEALIAEIKPEAIDQLVFVGDYTDRGPRSRDVIDHLLRLEAASRSGDGPRCVFLRGNHDQMMLDWIARGTFDLWFENGGTTTLASYATDTGAPSISDEHKDFLRRTRLYLDTPEFCFVHAGLNPDRSVADNLRVETADTFLWTRRHFHSERHWEKTVVCGHTPVPKPLMMDDLIAIDTGCVFPHIPEFGRLSAVRLPEREVVQVPYQD